VSAAAPVAVVTGAARGIGAATVARLRADGAAVAGLDCDYAEPVEEREGELRIRCDVDDPDAVGAAFELVADRLGAVRMLVNNAGVNAYHDPAAMTVVDWDRVMGVDLRAVWLCTKHAIPSMRRGGGGAIVNVSSIHAHQTLPEMFPYAAAKAGVLGLTRSLALDLGPAGIRVNAICPGYIRTRLVEEWLDRQPDRDEAERRVIALHAVGRIGRPEDVAAAAAFLLSDEQAGFVTGATLMVDGGHGVRFPT
jgi:NAD(P)-dependent dehydrogenase (short-subunit alcohol dehydrogenase family)